MRKLILLCAAIAALSLCASAQYVTITGSKFGDSSGTPLSTGRIIWTPTTSANTGTPVGYLVNGRGATTKTTIACNIVGGAIVQPCKIADTSLTSPLNMCFFVTVKNSATNQNVLGPEGYTCVQPVANPSPGTTAASWCSAGTCNVDQLAPNLAPLVAVQSGPQGVPGIGSDPDCHADGSGTLTCSAVAATKTVQAGAPTVATGSLLAQYLLKEGSGATIADSSGNGYDATFPAGSGAPTWASTSGSLSFAWNNNQYVALPAALNGAKTITIAYTFGPFYSNTYALQNNNPILIGASGSTGPYMKATWGVPTAASNPKYSGIPAIVSASANRTWAYDFGGIGSHIVTYVLGASGSTLDHIYLDGLEVGGGFAYNAQAASAGLLTSGNWQLGYTSAITGSSFHGQIHGVWMWSDEKPANQVLSDVTNIRRWLENTRPLIFGNAKRPVQKLGNTLVCVGDSITYGGNNSSTPWCSGTAMIFNDTFTVYNAGISGAWTLDWAGNLAAAAYYQQTAGKQVATLMLGTNDINGGVTAANTFHSFAATARGLQKLGYKVIVVPMLSRNGYDSGKNSYNSLLQQYWPNFGDSYCNVAADPLLGADGASTNATYFNTSDKTHPTTAGNALIATKVANCVNELYGSSATAWNATTAASYSEAAADKYLVADPTANAVAVTLPDCTLGYGTLRYIKALNGAHAVTVAPYGTQTIDGSTSAITVPAGMVMAFQPFTASYATAGCAWYATQGTSASSIALGYTAENTSNKGLANGYAPLDAGAKVPAANLPISTSTSAVIRGYCNGVATANTTIGLYMFGESSTTNCTGAVGNSGAFIGTHAGTLQNLYVTAINAGGVNASSGVVTLYDNGVATALTCTLGTGTVCSDTTHQVAAAAGHLYTLRITTQTGETLSGIVASVDYQ